MAVNFVKFERGTSTVYNRRKNNHSLDENTLYFIYDKSQPENGGLLYLGYTLIGGTGANSNISVLNDLSDVDLTVVNELAGGMLLRYSSVHQKWEPVSISQALSDANIDFSGSAGVGVYSGTLQENEEISDALTRLVAAPNEGDLAIIEGQPYVYDGSSWIPLTNSILEDRVSSLESDVTNIQSELESIDGRIDSLEEAIANVDHLSYVVLDDGETTSDIDLSADGANNKVYLVPNPEADINSGNKYDEFMIVNGQLEKLGSWGVDLSNYVTFNDLSSALNNYITSSDLSSTLNDYVTSSDLSSTLNDYVTSSDLQTEIEDLANIYVTQTEFENTVGDLESLAAKLEKENFSIASGLDELYDMLTWSDIEDPGE